MSENQSPALDQLKKTHEQLAFIHQVLTQRTQYFLDEVDIAKDCARTITDMANKLSDDIQSQMEAATASEEKASEEKASDEQA